MLTSLGTPPPPPWAPLPHPDTHPLLSSCAQLALLCVVPSAWDVPPSTPWPPFLARGPCSGVWGSSGSPSWGAHSSRPPARLHCRGSQVAWPFGSFCSPGSLIPCQYQLTFRIFLAMKEHLAPLGPRSLPAPLGAGAGVDRQVATPPVCV